MVRTILDQLNPMSADWSPDAWSTPQTVLRDDAATDDGHVKDGSVAKSPPHLYECPSCDRIYVASKRHTCSTCETAIVRVQETD